MGEGGGPGLRGDRARHASPGGATFAHGPGIRDCANREKPGITLYERGETVRAAVLSPGTPYASWTLLIVNLLFFAHGAVFVLVHDLSIVDYLKGICETENGTPVLYELGGLYTRRTVPEGAIRHVWRPQLERILLFLFLHAGALHLMMNMGFLATMAREIEAMWGWARFLTIYFVAGIVSGCVIILLSRLEQFRSEPATFTVGASGPLCGLFTAMVVWFALNYEHLPENLMQEWSTTLSITLILLLAVNFMPNVSWQGHFGGAVGGLLTALLLHAQRFSSSLPVRVLGLAAVPLIPLGFFLAVLWQAGWF